MIHKPTNNLKKLYQHYIELGWYGGLHDLVKVTLQGGFEAFRGRASETWEHRFIIETAEIKLTDNKTIPSIKIEGKEAEELDDIAKKVLDKLVSLQLIKDL